MRISEKSWGITLKKNGISFLLVAILGLMLSLLIMPVASAQSTTQTTDESQALIRALANDRYYVATSVKSNSTFMQKNANIEQSLKDTVNKLKGKEDTRIAVVSNTTVPTKYTNLEAYANFLYNGAISSPSPSVLVMVNAQSNSYSLISNKLSEAERSAIISDARSRFNSGGVTAGTVYLAQAAVDKIESKATTSMLTTIGIVVVVILVIVGAVAYMLVSTKKRWVQQVAGVERLADEVSDRVVKMSDEVQFLPDAQRKQTDVDFGTATRNFSDANAGLRELQKVSPVTLLLKGPEYQRKLNLTGSQFEEARRMLVRVEQQVQRSLPG